MSEEISFRGYISPLLARWKIVVLIFVVALASTFYITIKTPPLYESFATIKLTAQPFADYPMAYMPPGDVIETDIQVAKSRTIAENVVENLALFVRAENRDRFEKLWVSRNTPQGRYIFLPIDEGSYYIISPSGDTLGQGNYGEEFLNQYFHIQLDPLSTRTGLTVLSFNSAAGSFKSSLKVRPIGTSSIIEIRCGAGNPELAALKVNATVEEFMKIGVTEEQKEAKAAREFIENQIKIIRENLSLVEQSLRRYKEASGIITLSRTAEEYTRTLRDFESAKAKAVIEKQETEKTLASLKKRLGYVSYTEMTIPVTDSVISSMRDEIARMEEEKIALISTHGEGYEKVKALQTSIDSIKQKIGEVTMELLMATLQTEDPVHLIREIVNLETNLMAIDERISAIGRIINGYQKKLSTLPKKEVELIRLERDLSGYEAMYDALQSNLQDARIREVMSLGDKTVVDSAVPSLNPVKPSKKLNLVLGAMLGLILGVGLAYILDYIDTSLKDKSEAEKVLSLPILASLSLFKTKKIYLNEEEFIRNHLAKSDKLNETNLIETFRVLKTNITFFSVDKPIKKIMVTSSLPMEGKSTCSVNTAISFARFGSKTLIIDCDLRKPILNGVFGKGGKPGLTDLLTDKDVSLSLAIQKTDIENLYLLTSGTRPPNPTELISSKKMSSILDTLGKEYEYIIIDTAPVITVADPLPVARLVDGVILVFMAGKTDRKLIIEAKNILLRAGANIIGAFMNGVKGEFPYSYYHHYHKDYYHLTEEDVQSA